jgi:hypothetical protein
MDIEQIQRVTGTPWPRFKYFCISNVTEVLEERFHPFLEVLTYCSTCGFLVSARYHQPCKPGNGGTPKPVSQPPWHTLPGSGSASLERELAGVVMPTQAQPEGAAAGDSSSGSIGGTSMSAPAVLALYCKTCKQYRPFIYFSKNDMRKRDANGCLKGTTCVTHSKPDPKVCALQLEPGRRVFPWYNSVRG